MHCKGKLKLGSLDTSYCLIEVVTKEGFDCTYICKQCLSSLTL
jgi:hypothetical protein